MREHIFKAKNLLNKEWVYGYYAKAERLDKSGYDCLISEESADGAIYAIDFKTLCEWTGTVDKNGVKIFENDIVSIPAYRRGKHITTVYFKDGKFAVDGSRYNYKDLAPRVTEVLGNIFDNPELLNKEN